MSKALIDHVATFIAAADGPRLSAEAVMGWCAAVGAVAIDWLEPGVAADASFMLAPQALPQARAALQAAADAAGVDVVVQEKAKRRKRLIVADMDSTMIAQECVDELAAYAGLRERVAPITARAMRGELDFESALRDRVALLAGLDVAIVETILRERVTPTPGARTLLATMRANGAYAALVTGGFTCFAEPIAARLGFNEARANLLETRDGRLTGAVTPPIRGASAKREALEALRAQLGLQPAETLAVGDGANDLDMLEAAGLGVAFHAKPKVAAAAHARIDRADLTALLFAQGYRRADFVA
ncbi:MULTISPECIES: phosphoserine phosphatase SerB [Methylosinus]|uniref:Phosphoserine phosphatase n=1 Tax=Methylosinus trichosporium (strain ATCC 35070 / NCIMB 11131 / UNIQEM 75 / OB3b) TaxID=595536 RepID=A0A2D2D3T9_METT3|nr:MULTISPECIES: phosphoserine phosphatase SerB [Methylosinus]ATQ69663.1 phosphoserine phosphatase SerB [Methylosinus trichosporium OB3b]OBS51249.1 phosphoserine phosphatase SerB [Methylosinus sp. 3S-1]